ncbi:dienelactone hydrolase family protein [Opitutus sp. ER46]|uniref:dienelactone hydrolase family protein n=1 Tax=Opitutus sp. ER46 TaxID=2161864 RepID=UPI000D30E91D|nr:dienelactone hydrolase family protein [Opitutus sp. ER46]PTX91755.1 dienelactone hydrolase [Opitutus sp. ER46]
MKLLACLCLLGAALTAQAKIVTRAVPYEHNGVKLEGYLAYDDAKSRSGRLPGVLVLPEWWGLNEYPKSRAEQLAKLGYVAFAADMYGAGVTTTDAKKAGELARQFYGKSLMAERARAGLDTLLASGLVDPQRVAAIGYCFGGAAAQVLAWSGAPLAGIVSFHGSLVPPPSEPGRVKARILVCHGAIDPFVKPEELAKFKDALDVGGLDYQFIQYAGAVHAFTNPRADDVARAAGLKGIGYNAAADRRSWQHMQDFFAELFGPRP